MFAPLVPSRRAEARRDHQKYELPARSFLPLSIDSLETFAETGEITGDFKLYARFLDDNTLNSLRQLLQFKLPLDVVTVSNLSYSPLGRDVLTNLGKVLESTPGVNGFHSLRAAVIGAAAKAGPEGWTLIDMMREFPTDSIDVSVQGLLELRQNAIHLLKLQPGRGAGHP